MGLRSVFDGETGLRSFISGGGTYDGDTGGRSGGEVAAETGGARNYFLNGEGAGEHDPIETVPLREGCIERRVIVGRSERD
jgi:hypothetical protein